MSSSSCFISSSAWSGSPVDRRPRPGREGIVVPSTAIWSRFGEVLLVLVWLGPPGGVVAHCLPCLLAVLCSYGYCLRPAPHVRVAICGFGCA